MAEKKSGSGMPFNATAVIALFTVVGGLFIASKKVSSDRPVSRAEGDLTSISDQQVQARLWQDPLDWKTNQPQADGEAAFELLRRQIAERAPTDPKPMLLPVMIHGGPYGEDQESRIRSRFAVISALGESGYAPEDATHIGAIEFSWPTTKALGSDWLANDSSKLQLQSIAGGSYELPVAFEWYRSRVFIGGGKPVPEQRVLVLWLNEEQFADYPQARLALLLAEIAGTNNAGATNLFENIALIGPRSSATLRAMLPAYGSNDYTGISASLRGSISNTLRQVDVFSPTASAMDEVLVAGSSNAPPRQPVEKILTNFWFRSFHNFCATDAQLAGEALDELRLRQVDLSNTNKNLVLISEWDTFYGRMLSLTYAAELKHFQNPSLSDIDFIQRYRQDANYWPTNLHCFVYLRGLDGQTTKSRPADSNAGEQNKPSFSLEDLKHGASDQNKAVGESQFDYLTRLGDRIKELESELKNQGRGRIDALGIIGSDPYDTLAILQALRSGFPNVVFFTTDLDARFLHPSQQEWSRNLIVISGYGLQLSNNLQGGVAPFRDSGQTAQFAATLAAFGKAGLLALTNIPPRRFEIGRLEPFDLSVAEGGILHPQPPARRGFIFADKTTLAKIGLVVLCGGFLLIYFYRRLQQLTWDAGQYEIECLWFRREDLGGEDGAARLVRQLKHCSGDSLASWLCNEWRVFSDRNPSLLDSGTEAPPLELQAFLDFLNQVVLQTGMPAENLMNSGKVKDETKEAFRQTTLENQSQGVFLQKNSVRRLQLYRRVLDELFTQVLESGDSASTGQSPAHDAGRMSLMELAHATRDARRAGLQQYRLRRNQRRAFQIGTPVFMGVLVYFLWVALHDSYYNSSGELFLLLAGISVWPTELLRLLAIMLAVIFVTRTYASLRAGIFDMTRRYRLPLTVKTCDFKWRLPATSAPQAAIDAGELWELYQQLGGFGQRVGRIIPLFLVYLVFCAGIMLLLGGPYSPVRGPVSSIWNHVLLLASVLTFIFLAFWIIDAAYLCRWLIERLSESPTRYPKSCLRHFARQRGLGKKPGSNENEDTATMEKDPAYDGSILAEWIDMKLIEQLTERVGRLVYCPFIVFFILLVSRNGWLDRWSWPPSLIIIFSLNLALAAASMLILQNAALKARDIGLENLRTKVEAAEQKAAPSPEANQAAVARKLLEELQSMDKGAFAPLWQNPLIGAILIPSGGSVLIQMLSYLFG
jgi:hypothetical protein